MVVIHRLEDTLVCLPSVLSRACWLKLEDEIFPVRAQVILSNATVSLLPRRKLLKRCFFGGGLSGT